VLLSGVVQLLLQAARCDVCDTHAIETKMPLEFEPVHQSEISNTKSPPVLCRISICEAADTAITTATAKDLSTDSQQAALEVVISQSPQYCKTFLFPLLLVCCCLFCLEGKVNSPLWKTLMKTACRFCTHQHHWLSVAQPGQTPLTASHSHHPAQCWPPRPVHLPCDAAALCALCTAGLSGCRTAGAGASGPSPALVYRTQQSAEQKSV